MSHCRICFVLLLLVGTLWNCVLSLQRPAPRYSQQYMPDTSFSCRNKIVGSYYADPETDCQLFHVCVSVAATIQDYRFLCPNDTAFDQESQTCADWYDVDCEAATLYYASDNFDLYRLGSGLESLHYDSIRNDVEPQDHLQRSESSDPIRSSANSLNKVASKGYNGNNDRDIPKGNGNGNFYNGRNNDKNDDYVNEKVYRESAAQETRRKTAVRKVTRKQQYNGSTRYVGNDGNDNYPQSTTAASTLSTQNGNGYNTNGNNYNNNFNQRQNNFASSTTQRSTVQQENFNKNQNNQKYSTYSSTYRPTTNHREIYDTYQSPSTTARPTEYDNFNNNGYNTNQQSASNFNQSPSTTIRPTSYNTNSKNSNKLFNQQSTTVRPSTNYQSSEYTNNHQRSYNNIQRSSSSTAFQSTTAASTFYDNYGSSSIKNNNEQYNNRGSSPSTTKQDFSQTTPKYLTNNFAGSSYIPTTYSPATKKFINNDNDKTKSSTRGNDQYGNIKSTQYYDSTKAPKKATQYNAYDNTNTGKYFDSNTENYNNYDFGKSSSSTGFSPASINHLAEGSTPTTPVARTAAVNTYNSNTFNTNTQRSSQSQTTPRGSTFVSGSARPFSTTSKPIETKITAKPKSGKKNDYDYAYYDNAGQLEYDSLDFDHEIGNKESSKISRN